MKILLLDHPQHTHATWTLYEGLKRVLGWGSLVVFPRKGTYHHEHDCELMSTAWYRDVYQEIADGYDLPRGIPPLAPGESLTTGDERVIRRNMLPFAFSAPDRQREYSEDEVVAEIDAGQFDLVILGNSNRVPTIALARLRDRCRALPPVVYLDGGERDEHNAHWTHLFRPALVFKQILTPEVAGRYRGNFVDLQVPMPIWPLPLANPFAHFEPMTAAMKMLLTANVEDRPIDVFSHFGPTWPARAALHGQVAAMVRRIGASGVLRAALCDQETGLAYFAILASTRVGVSMRGSGRDTDRYWQIPALGATLLCDGTMGCIHPHPFRDGETAVFYRTCEEAERKLEWLLGDPGAQRAIAAAGRQHLLRFHCVEARALFFLAVVRQEIGVGADDSPAAISALPAGGTQRDAIAHWTKKLGWGCELPEWRGPVAGFDEGAAP